ncbi:MAG: 16S rRNA (cytosine(1402)-N(4))-methyltransferase RsmH [Patescibacteria group bacterium]
MAYNHIPVMLSEVLEYLKPEAGQKFIDGTLGGAGYTLALAKVVGDKGRILSTDLDQLAIGNAEEKIKQSKLKNIVLVKDNFKNLAAIVKEKFPTDQKFDGIVFDLGLSSAQLDDEDRGFSFKSSGPLNMAFGTGGEISTEEIVNEYPLLELTRIFKEYGEERQAYRYAKGIVDARKFIRIKTTADLVSIIENLYPAKFYHKTHPATKLFQALRIETNGELNSLKQVLPDAIELLKPNGKIVIISFHSGEDRIVKRFFKSRTDLKILTKRPLVPSDSEIMSNPRSRSAKLRAAQKIN